MTNQEFSDKFDVLFNNIASNQAPGLDNYEKSVILTLAQDDVVKSYFNPVYNKAQQGFDGNQKRQIDFSMITKTVTVTSFESALFDYRANSKSVQIPNDILIILNEQCLVSRHQETTKSQILQVIPINYSEYTRLMQKPFKRPVQFQAWRLLNTETPIKNDLIVGPSDTVTKYTIRYVKKPRAIILYDLEDTTIDGMSHAQTCELDKELHQEILMRAVELAKSLYTGDLNSIIALGQTSSTEKGVVTKG